MSREPVVAIDGPAGSGKSTVARQVAKNLNFLFIDTGAMYRAVTLAAVRQHIDIADPVALTELAEKCYIKLANETDVTRVFINDEEVTEDIRDPELNPFLSTVAAVPGVRRRLVALQRELGKAGGVVMEGRDIGTVVFPDAEIKVYLDASVAERARRRCAELQDKGINEPENKVRREIEARDNQDMNREDSPLRRADDAYLLVTDGLSIPEVVEQIVNRVAAAG